MSNSNKLKNIPESKAQYFKKIGEGKVQLFNDKDELMYECELSEVSTGLENRTRYNLELNEKQLSLIWKYLETMTRINALQTKEASSGILKNLIDNKYLEAYSKEYFQAKDQLENILDLIPPLFNYHNGASFGINNVCEDDKIGYEIYKLIGKALYTINGNNSDWNVYSSDPLHYSNEQFIKINIQE